LIEYSARHRIVEHSVVSEIVQILVRSPSISHATASAANAPEFADFFAHAVGNYLIGVAFSGTPDREEVLRHEAELEKPTGYGGFFAAMAHPPSWAEIADALESTEAEEEDAISARISRPSGDLPMPRTSAPTKPMGHRASDARRPADRSREAAPEVPGRRGGLDPAGVDGAAG
jgi:hypothetical protein